MRALSIAATGMEAQQTRVEVISNNLANMNTTAYAPRRAEFADLHYQQVARPGTVTAANGTELPTGIQLGLGARVEAISVERSQGALRQTSGTLDVAIEGRGFLEITLPDGSAAYTRDGGLKRSGEGQIVTSEGFSIVPDLVIPDEAQDIEINAEGEVYVFFNGATAPELLGQITLTTFPNNSGLQALGGNLFAETEASGAPTVGAPGEQGRGTLRQGFLEESGVDSVREMTDLIEAQRGYELNAKVLSAADQMLAATAQVR
ncbi:MAG: flagellar basal-body rod protein FlgG [Pseudomonadota bacterium]